MDVKQRLRLPQQQRGHHDELEELAAILSAEADARHASLTIIRDDPDDLAPTVIHRRPTHRGWRVAGGVVLALVASAVGILATSLLRSAAPAPAPATRPVAATTALPPDSPASWGAAARVRLSAGGRPVSVFGCTGAYEIDVQRSSGMLPIAYQGTPEYREYMTACLSDMSGQPIAPNEVAR